MLTIAAAYPMWRKLLTGSRWSTWAVSCQAFSFEQRSFSFWERRFCIGLVRKIRKKRVDKLGAKGMQLTIADLPFWTAHWWKIGMWWIFAFCFRKFILIPCCGPAKSVNSIYLTLSWRLNIAFHVIDRDLPVRYFPSFSITVSKTISDLRIY